MIKKLSKFVILFSTLVISCSSANIPTGKQEELNTITPTFASPIIQEKWWHSSVCYEIFVRSFFDSDADGIGDINGIIKKLDYLNDGNPETKNDLGIDCIWLMPIFPASSYHGYDVEDYKSVNNDYGTLEDLQKLLVEAHERGIKIIIDFVLNHTSSQHPWFLEAQNTNSKYHDYYIWSDQNPGYLGPDGQQVWHQAENGQFYYGLFDDSMPDLNFTNPNVTQEIYEITRYWLQDIGIDGFRLDGARHLIEEGELQENTQATHHWYKEFRQFYTSINADAYMVGEVWDDSSNLLPYVQGDELDMVFNFDFASAMMSAASERSSFLLNYTAQNNYLLFSHGMTMATFLTNHDINRSMSSFTGIPEKAKIAATLLLTLPGTPFVYYGEEIGMVGQKPDPQIRTPMQWTGEQFAGFSSAQPWEEVNQDFRERNVAQQTDDPNSLLSYYRFLIALRQENSALGVGEFYQLTSEDTKSYSYIRSEGETGFLIILNLSNKDLIDYTFSLLSSPFRGVITSDMVYGTIAPAQMQFDPSGNLVSYKPFDTIPPNSIFIAEFNINDEEK